MLAEHYSTGGVNTAGCLTVPHFNLTLVNSEERKAATTLVSFAAWNSRTLSCSS